MGYAYQRPSYGALVHYHVFFRYLRAFFHCPASLDAGVRETVWQPLRSGGKIPGGGQPHFGFRRALAPASNIYVHNNITAAILQSSAPGKAAKEKRPEYLSETSSSAVAPDVFPPFAGRRPNKGRPAVHFRAPADTKPLPSRHAKRHPALHCPRIKTPL
jgi:hypothetical protein